MNALAARIKSAAPAMELGTAAFTHSYPAPPLRTWDVANWGTYQPPASSHAPQAASQAGVTRGITPIVSNERVTVRDVTLTPGTPEPMEQHREDSVTVFLTGGMVKVTQSDGTSRVVTRNANDAVFAPKGGASSLEAVGHTVRAVMIDLHDHAVAPLPNTTGLPEAFPRPGSKHVFENDRIVIWDYTFVPGQPSPMHFHSRDVVTIYTDDGAVTSTTPAGDVTVNNHTFGQTLFNPRNRTHTEVLSRGKVHIVVVELK
jgi:quercetin dioxygenase-like cupin family protein